MHPQNVVAYVHYVEHHISSSFQFVLLCREEEPEDVPHGHITSLVSFCTVNIKT